MELDNLMYAVLFREMEVEADGEIFVVFIPDRPVVGTLSYDGKILKEIISGQKHLFLDYAFLSDIPDGFHLVRPLLEIKNFEDTYNIIEKNKMYVYDANSFEDGELLFCEVDLQDFENTYGVNLAMFYTEDASRAVEDLVSGRINDDEYYKRVYEGIESKENSKVIKLNFNN